MDKILLSISASALEIRNAQLNLGKELRAVKLSFEEAMSFRGHFSSFTEMKAKYGEQNVLRLGEQYEGYIAVYYTSWKQDVVMLRGAVLRENDTKALMFSDLAIRKACEQRTYYKVIYSYDENKNVPGGFHYVWTFNECRFAELADLLKKQNDLDENISSEELDKSLKEKITTALVTNSSFELSQPEFTLLKSYLGNYFYDIFRKL